MLHAWISSTYGRDIFDFDFFFDVYGIYYFSSYGC